MNEDDVDEMFVYEELNPAHEPTGVLSLNIVFSDALHRVHSGYMSTRDNNRAAVATMLRELATQIEYDVTGRKH